MATDTTDDVVVQESFSVPQGDVMNIYQIEYPPNIPRAHAFRYFLTKKKGLPSKGGQNPVVVRPDEVDHLLAINGCDEEEIASAKKRGRSYIQRLETKNERSKRVCVEHVATYAMKALPEDPEENDEEYDDIFEFSMAVYLACVSRRTYEVQRATIKRHTGRELLPFMDLPVSDYGEHITEVIQQPDQVFYKHYYYFIIIYFVSQIIGSTKFLAACCCTKRVGSMQEADALDAKLEELMAAGEVITTSVKKSGEKRIYKVRSLPALQ